MTHTSGYGQEYITRGGVYNVQSCKFKLTWATWQHRAKNSITTVLFSNTGLCTPDMGK